MEPEAVRAAAESRRLNAEADKFAAEADKLQAEARRIRRATVKDAWMIGLAVFGAGLGSLQLADSLGWL